MLRPGDILLAEDTAGTGHSWKLIDEQPWRRAYVILAPGVEVPFVRPSRPVHRSQARSEGRSTCHADRNSLARPTSC